MNQKPQPSRITLLLLLLPASLFGDVANANCANVVEIAPQSYLRPGQHVMQFEDPNVANAGFIVGNRCVAVIDTGGSASEGEELACAIAKVTDLPVCYVINTHAHPDHILGNQAFAGTSAKFVGHEHLARAFGIRGPTYLERASEVTGNNETKPILISPDLELSESQVIDLGGRELLISPVASAHTNSDVIVYDMASDTLWLGDLLFVDHIPVVDASLLGWLKVMDDLQSRPYKRVVPGHGPVQTDWPEGLAAQRRYLELLRDETRLFLEADGRLKDATAAIGQSEAKSWQLFEQFHARNVSATYTELEWEN